MFIFETIFKHFCSKGGGVKSVVEVTVNSEENSLDFSLNDVQEFGLRTQATKK
jgi:hypothetical protein